MPQNIFLFEYATCGAFPELKPSIAVEGIGMFKTLLEGYEALKWEILTFIDSRIPYFREFPRVESYEELFFNLLENAEHSLIIAPETDFEFYRLTKELEKFGCANLGSNSKAVYETSDKYMTYKKLKIATPRTEIFDGSTEMELPLIAKPRDGVSCEGIFLVEKEEDLKKVPMGYLIQEYIQGKAMSASLLVGDEIKVLSVNTQEIRNFTYTGAKLPVEMDIEDVLKAVEGIRGLQGYVGVDFVYNGEVNIIEINARPTTPIIALERAFGINISELIFKNYYHERIPELKADRKIYLKKVRGKTKGSLISFHDYSINLENLNEDIDF